jgi:AP-2 complex subunit mu-1
MSDIEKLKQITVRATGAISWRAEGIRYRRNEVFIDIIENVNVLLSNRGTVLKADVYGRVAVKAHLSGMPECKFGVNDKLLMRGGSGQTTGQEITRKNGDKGIMIDDIKFHQCVRLGRFDRDRSITFIPPDGAFDVMTYRISENINLPFKIVPVVQEYPEQCKIELSIRLKAIFEESNYGTNVVAKIPVPSNTA